MRRIPFFVLVLLVAGLAPTAGQAPARPAAEDHTARYADRTIDLRPYLGLDDAALFRPGRGDGRLYFVHQTPDGWFWKSLPLEVLAAAAPIDVTTTDEVYPGLDRSARVLSPPLYDSVGGAWYAFGDSANDERTNVWAVRPGTPETRRVTGEDGLWSAAVAGGRIAYLARHGHREPYGTCLRLHTVATGRAVSLVCGHDSPRFTGTPLWRPDGGAFVLSMTADRAPNLALFEVRGDSAVRTRWLLPDSAGRTVAAPRAWRGTDRLRYVEAVDGVRNIHELDLTTGRSEPVTRFDERLGWAPPGLVEIGDREVVLVNRGGAASDTVALLDTGGRTLGSFALPAGARIGFGDGRGNWWVERASLTLAGEAHALQVRITGDSARFRLQPMVAPSTHTRRGFDACEIEPVSYETFDGRTIHGHLRTPRTRPPPGEPRLGIVVAFYGGEEEYDGLAALWCDAGITSLSPAVRGSYTREPEFAALTHGDRGGDEIVDVILAARWLAERMGVGPRHIGVYGTSRGGYNALQALTFDPSINGRHARFDFGFGIAEAGYSSLLTILHRTNTESPEIIATGDPDTPDGRATLRARSPADQAHRLDAPLLLIHGTADRRVQFDESRDMLEAARRAGKDGRLLELPGVGHGVRGAPSRAVYLRGQLRFLDQVRRALDERDGE